MSSPPEVTIASNFSDCHRHTFVATLLALSTTLPYSSPAIRSRFCGSTAIFGIGTLPRLHTGARSDLCSVKSSQDYHPVSFHFCQTDLLVAEANANHLHQSLDSTSLLTLLPSTARCLKQSEGELAYLDPTKLAGSRHEAKCPGHSDAADGLETMKRSWSSWFHRSPPM